MGFRLDSPVEGVGALAPTRFNLVRACALACMDRHACVKHNVRTITTTKAILAQGHFIQEDVKFGVPSVRRVDPFAMRRAVERGN